MERSLIDAIAAELASSPSAPRLLRGIGDDAAVVRSGGALCVTSVDTMVEGVHFRLADGERPVRPRRDGRQAGRGIPRARPAFGI
jgi:thiamine monophosphate kinase